MRCAPSLTRLLASGVVLLTLTPDFALAAPPKTSAAIIDKINAAVNEALRDPTVIKRLADLTAEPAGGTPQATAAYFGDEAQRWKNVIVSAHVTLD